MKYSESIVKHANDVIHETNFRSIASLDTSMRSISWDIESLLNCNEIDLVAVNELNTLYSALANIKAARKEL